MKISLKSIINKLEVDDISSISDIINMIIENKDILYFDCNLSVVFKYLDNYSSNDNLINNYVNYLKDNLLKINNELDIKSKYRDYKIECLLNKS